MNDRDILISQVVDKLKQIKTLKDLKASEELVINLMESVFKASVRMFNEFLENIDSIAEKEKEPKILMFQDENFFLPPAIMVEMERLDNFPGDREFLDTFGKEMEKRMDPFLDQYSECADQLMKKLFGGLVDGVSDAMGGMEGEMGEVIGDVTEGTQDETRGEEPFIFDYENPNTPRMLFELYAARELDEIDMDTLIEDIEEQLQEDIWELERITDPDFVHTIDEDSIMEMQTRMKLLEPELEKEFTRLGSTSDSREAASQLKKELMGKLALKVREIKHYLATI